MPSKMTIFFNLYNSGFSETFYHSNDDPQQLSKDISNDLYQLAAKMRHSSVLIKAVRFSRVQPPNEALVGRLSFLVRPYPKAQGTRTTVLDPGPEPASTTAVYMLQSTNGARRRLWMRGLADIDVRRDIFGNDLESSTLFSMRNDYFLALYQAGFQIRWLARPPLGGLTWRKVALVNHEVSPAADRAGLVLSVLAPEFNAGDIVSFTGTTNQLPGFPRSTTIIAKTTLGGVLHYMIPYRLPGGVAVAPAKLQMANLKYNQSTISLWAFERFGEHKTGRPFGSLRGRSRGAVALR